MVEIKVEIKNLDKIEATFRKAPLRMTQELGVAIERVITKVESSAKKNAPVNKQSGGGNLRQSIRSQVTGPASGIVEVTALYAAAVHEGSRPHIIRVKTKKVLANKRLGQIFGRVVNHPGTKAQPFLQDAINQEQSFIDKEFKNAVERVIT